MSRGHGIRGDEMWHGARTVSLISVVFACSPPAHEMETNGTTPERGGETDRCPRVHAPENSITILPRENRGSIDRSEIKTFFSFFQSLKGIIFDIIAFPELDNYFSNFIISMVRKINTGFLRKEFY